MLDRLDTTIVAVSSAPGYGAVGIVRLSGPNAIDIADHLASLEHGQMLSSMRASTRVVGEVRIDDDCPIPACFYLFRAPRSYTRQDLLEIHTIGSPPVLEMVLDNAIRSGAVPAEPGEFTARAFLNGAMSLSRAEAVASVIRAQTDTQLRAARRMMEGTHATRIVALRNELAELLALVEADIDFAEEPIDFITPGKLNERLDRVNVRLTQLSAQTDAVECFDVLPHILLFGPPNAGKSTLMNRLSGTSRAICAAAAGTTRDILSAPIRLGRGEAILLDTAGIDRSEDDVMAVARARTLTEAERVDALCIVTDLSRPERMDPLAESISGLGTTRMVIAANKSDAVSRGECDARLRQLEAHQWGPVCPVSARTGEGIDALRDELQTILGDLETTTLGEAELLSRRQQRAVVAAGEAIRRAGALCQSAEETIDCADLLAVELREAMDELGAVTGEITTDDLLGQVFANFCIGK